jgi:integrase
MFNWAVEQGHLERSPCAGLGMPAQAISRDRILSDGELARVWKAAGEMGYPFGPMIQLLILTAQRRGEVVGLRWSELDTNAMEWTLPNGRTKSARAHIVPLSGAAAELVTGLPRLHDVLVFPARGKNNPASGFSKWKRELDERSGVVDWRIHDLRRTAASGMAQLAVPPHIIERVLNHTTGTLGGVAGIYNRYGYLVEMRSALERWWGRVGALISNEP